MLRVQNLHSKMVMLVMALSFIVPLVIICARQDKTIMELGEQSKQDRDALVKMLP